MFTLYLYLKSRIIKWLRSSIYFNFIPSIVSNPSATSAISPVFDGTFTDVIIAPYEMTLMGAGTRRCIEEEKKNGRKWRKTNIDIVSKFFHCCVWEFVLIYYLQLLLTWTETFVAEFSHVKRFTSLCALLIWSSTDPNVSTFNDTTIFNSLFSVYLICENLLLWNLDIVPR